MSGERTNEERINILNHGNNRCGRAHREKHTYSSVPHTDCGRSIKKKRLSQPKVSMHSSVSHTDTADDRNKRDLAQTW